jgi:S1-C subfamily serine protease
MGATVTYDREEWRRPWRAMPAADPIASDTRPITPPPGEEAPAPGAHDRVSTATAGPAASVEVEGLPEEPYGPAPGDQAGWERPDGTPTVAPPAGIGPAPDPIARYPQPPPSSWDAAAAGPGSPPGSVRPPDTTGTVDAPEKTRRRGVLGVALGALVGAVVGTAATLALYGSPDTSQPDAPVASNDVSAPAIELTGDGAVVPAVAAAVTPSVVRIDVSQGPGDGPVSARPSLGSGVIYRSDGYILTNHHVVEGADEVTVRLASGEILDGEVIGSDELNDLAVVRVAETGLPAINVRPENEPLIVGETVVAIGSPFGLDASVTAGVISALNREIRLDEPQEGGGLLTIPSVIQTDAAINPGNSGGALVDAQGRLVGINTAILTRSGASQGVGFAVSAEQAMVSADQLIDEGFVRHPLLGIAGIDVEPEVAERFGLAASRGAVVESVQDGTGAQEAGLRPGDIIVEIDGEPLATMSELVAEVRRRQPGDVMELRIIRDGEPVDVEVTLSERPRS